MAKQHELDSLREKYLKLQALIVSVDMGTNFILADLDLEIKLNRVGEMRYSTYIIFRNSRWERYEEVLYEESEYFEHLCEAVLERITEISKF